jgi:RNA polymerase sigma-70 factor, ECF subfamily
VNTTSPTLLGELREANRPQSWSRFVDLYTPLLLAWARRAGLQPEDAADLIQDVFAVLLVQLPRFQYDPAKQNFRGWLRTVCLNKWRDRKRRKNSANVQASPVELAELRAEAELEDYWESEHNAFLVRQALLLMEELKSEFDPQTIDIVREFVLNQKPAGEVAVQFGVTSNAVYIAKLRVTRRLREELVDFIE